MLRDRLRQGYNVDERVARGRHRSELSPPVVRSPALESAERQEQQAEKGVRRSLPAKKVAPPRNAGMSYAAQDTLVRPVRKSLPPRRSRPGVAARPAEKQRTGLTALNWRCASRAWQANLTPGCLQQCWRCCALVW